MCLYPQKIKNKRYLPTKKNNYTPYSCDYEPKLYVEIPCGWCIECRKARARDWNIRLQEELLHDNGQPKTFVTLTFSDEKIVELLEGDEIGEFNNAIVSKAIRRFTEYYRKRNGKAPKHWLISELGHTGTERLHLHGIIWDTPQEIRKTWNYGYSWCGIYVSGATIGYLMKYVTKFDQDHKFYIPQIWASKGIGKGYLTQGNITIARRDQNYRTLQGQELALPTYYRNKIFSEDERDFLYEDYLRKGKTTVQGIKCDKDSDYYNKLIEEGRKKNNRLGYKLPKKDENIFEIQPENVTTYHRRKLINNYIIEGTKHEQDLKKERIKRANKQWKEQLKTYKVEGKINQRNNNKALNEIKWQEECKKYAQ